MHFESRTQYHNCAEIVVSFVLAPGFFSEIIGFFSCTRTNKSYSSYSSWQPSGCIATFPNRKTCFVEQITSKTVTPCSLKLRVSYPYAIDVRDFDFQQTVNCLLKQFNFVFQGRFREAFYKEGIITAIVQRLVIDNEELQGYCANAIFKVK